MSHSPLRSHLDSHSQGGHATTFPNATPKTQWILYNQCGQNCLLPGVQRVVFLCNATPPSSPVGTLHFHPLSQLYSYAVGYNFVQECKEQGLEADFLVVDDYQQGLRDYANHKHIDTIYYMNPSEPYLADHIVRFSSSLASQGCTLVSEPTTQFLITQELFQKKFEKPPIMESFYRRMRKETGILMQDDKPLGGKRNFDKENRKFDKKFIDIPHYQPEETLGWKKAGEYFADQVKEYNATHGSPDYLFPTSRKQALALLDYFVETILDRFGELEDAMYDTSDFVHHSLLSVPLNFGLLSLQEVIDAIENADTAINNKEGFIRQVLGRREYMYHWLWNYKDTIYEQNFFAYTKQLPYRFWETNSSPLQMNCVNNAIKKVDRLGYAHHIERLMIIGNFCLLTGINPTGVTKWFWEQYIDAFERVVTPNVMGMSQYADGGNLATKPYVASANYINKMSNHCASCVYDPKEKYGPNACPLNYLYRNFVNNNQETFKKGRQSFILNHLKKLDNEKIAQKSKEFIKKL